MADVKQAAKWMQEGKRVYSYDSNRTQAIYMSENELFYTVETGARVQIQLPDLLAEDWEIAE
jgi:hypothetical protein